MTFNGFSNKTPEYFLNICLDNTKSNFEAHRQEYDGKVKAPLRALHEALVPVFGPQAFGDLVGAVVLGDFLADNDDILVALDLLGEGLVQRGAVINEWHDGGFC